MWHLDRRYAALLIWAAAVYASLMSCQQTDTAPAQKGEPGGTPTAELPRAEVMVEPGVADDAEAYYRETFAAPGIPHDVVKGEPRMAAMLAYLGYPDLKPLELENTPSPELMKHLGDDLLASAFFAPKITDVSVRGSADINVGRRKVIRLRARPGSDAAKHDIAAGFLLFNKFQGKNHRLNPFEQGGRITRTSPVRRSSYWWARRRVTGPTPHSAPCTSSSSARSWTRRS